MVWSHLTEDPESHDVYNAVDRHHDGKWGWVIYRTAYGDDSQWQNFMDRLNRYLQERIGNFPSAHLIKDDFAFTVMEDEEKLKDATKQEVREMFKEWVKSVNGSETLVKYQHCIYADQEVVDSVMNGDEPEDESINHPSCFIKLLDPDFDKDIDYDDDCGLQAIDGSTRYDVGWMKVPPGDLNQRGYGLWEFLSWEELYYRPPEIVKLP